MPSLSLPLPLLHVTLCALVVVLAVASRLPCVRASAANADACAALSDTLSAPSITVLPRAAVPPGFCASVLWSPRGNEGSRKLRGIVLVQSGRSGALVVDSTAGSLLWMNDTDGSGRVDEDATPVEFATVLTQSGLNHGIALTAAETVLLASSASGVYRWPFDPSNPAAPITAAAEVLVRNIPVNGHSTRTITLDPNNENMLYVSVGSDAKSDRGGTHGKIRAERTLQGQGRHLSRWARVARRAHSLSPPLLFLPLSLSPFSFMIAARPSQPQRRPRLCDGSLLGSAV